MSYTVVVDLEMCRVPKANKSKYHFGSEIIQIGATALDENFEIVDGYSCYVHPEYGSIDGFIKKLTGISSADVAVAGTIKDAIEAFIRWIPEDAVLVSWSINDKEQLEREMAEKKIKNERLSSLFESWIDCQPMFAEKMDNNRKYNLEEALIAADIISYGNAHDGLDDAYNTALLYKKMMTESEFRLNSYYLQAHSEQEVRLTSTMGDLLKGFNLSALAMA